MPQPSVKRRELLKAGSSMTAVAVTGYSATKSAAATDESDSPSQPEPVDPEEYTLPADYTINEWRGPLELGDDQKYWMQKILKDDEEGEDLLSYGECLILEFEIEVPRLGDSVEVFVLQEDDVEDFREDAKLTDCLNWGRLPLTFGGNTFPCWKSTEMYDSDSVPGEVVKIEPGETRYVRFLLPDTDYRFVIDPTGAVDAGAGDSGVDREVVSMELEPKIRLIKDNSKLAERQVGMRFEDWFSNLENASTDERISGAQQFARSVCDTALAEQVASESIEDFADDLGKIEQYSGFAESVLSDSEEHFLVDTPDEFADEFNNLARWGSNALPFAASLISIAENSCEIAHLDPGVSREVLGEKVENLVMSVAGFVIQVVFLKLGLARQVAGTTIKAAETFVMGHVRKLAGLRLFAYVVNVLAVRFEEGAVFRRWREWVTPVN